MSELLAILGGLGLLLIGAFLGIFIDNYVKRPKLIIAGGGGGGGSGPGIHQHHISVRNEPGQFGIRLEETTVLGRRIHRRIEKGLVFDRIPAHECRAHMYDKKTGEHIRMLWWRSDPGSTYTQVITLNSGEKADLMLFARLYNERSKYFVFEPQSDAATPKIPGEEEKFNDSRDFIVEVQYFYGKKKFKTEVRMVKGFDGRLSYQTKGGGGSF